MSVGEKKSHLGLTVGDIHDSKALQDHRTEAGSSGDNKQRPIVAAIGGMLYCDWWETLMIIVFMQCAVCVGVKRLG